GYKDMRDWYNIKEMDILERGGAGLLKHYNGYLVAAISEIYDNYDWQPWLFKEMKESSWKDHFTRRKFFEYCAQKLGINNSMEGWNKVRSRDIIELGGGGLLSLYENSYYKCLWDAFPELEILPWKFEEQPMEF